MTKLMEHLILLVSSNTGAYVAELIGMEVSSRTLLRAVDHGEVQAPTPRVLGIDDFALRRGRTYGTLLCDLDSGKPIDVLLGRTKEPVLGWLKGRSGIEIVARDRASAYADAVRGGAPQAVQVADRFHLVKNLFDALKEVADRQSWALPEPTPLPVSHLEPETDPEPAATLTALCPKPMTRVERKRVAAAERLQRRYEEARRLRSNGMSIREIRQATGLSTPSILKYIHASEVPKRAERRRVASLLDPFVDYLGERWRAGCRHTKALYKEIVGQGYTGSMQTLNRLLHPWRVASPPPAKTRPHSSRKKDSQTGHVTWKEMRAAVLCPPEHLDEAQRQLLPDFLTLHVELELARNLVHQFRCILQQHDTAAFDTWLQEAANSELEPFARLAKTFTADRAAVLAAIELKWSTAQVEGQITRVKLIKRIGYGRASLPLLRARILNSAQRDRRPRKRKSNRTGGDKHASA